jgi:3D (Asp-Asp-Asp) domain-containing protein
VTTRVRQENGVEVSREQVSSMVISEPVNEIIAYGTKVVIRTIDTPEGPLEYWRVLRNMVTTSYHPAALGGDDVTAIGMKLTKGIVGADPKLIPYRTRIYVPGYGVGIVADTGGPRSTRYWIDLGYDDENYVPWSRRDTSVYLLTPVPENINYLLPPR